MRANNAEDDCEQQCDVLHKPFSDTKIFFVTTEIVYTRFSPRTPHARDVVLILMNALSLCLRTGSVSSQLRLRLQFARTRAALGCPGYYGYSVSRAFVSHETKTLLRSEYSLLQEPFPAQRYFLSQLKSCIHDSRRARRTQMTFCSVRLL